MRTLRVAIAQINARVGDITANCQAVVAAARDAARQGAELVVCPEMVVTGYPIEDLALRASFRRASMSATEQLAKTLAQEGLGNLPVIVGYVGEAPDPTARLAARTSAPQNCAAVLHAGRVVARYAKHHLPNYGVFDEFRIFVPGHSPTTIRVAGVDIALAICEDIWQDDGPVSKSAQVGAEVLVVINGSPFEISKDDTRLALVRRRAAETGCAVVYANLVGAQDDLVFDGDSLVVSADGELVARAHAFVEEVTLVDVPVPDPVGGQRVDGAVHVTISEAPEDGGRPDSEVTSPAPARPIATDLPATEAAYRALVLGLRDYVRKNGFRSVVLGLSGGIDSALVAAIAADAIGAAHVYGVSMPSQYSSDHSKDDARDLAQRLGMQYEVRPIADMVEAFAVLQLTGVSAENLQARVRGLILMGLSNGHGHLTLATGNKSELSVGYSTIYGDSVGGYAPLKDVPKTLVWELARWRNTAAVDGWVTNPIPENSITKPPSAELRPGQVDQDSLPPYELLDAVLERYVVHAEGRAELLAHGFDEAVVDRVLSLVDRAEWKRRQFAPGPKITPVAFGRDRRLPITSAWREQA